MTHQVVVHEVSVATGHRVLVDRLGRVLQLVRLVDHSIWHRHGLPLGLLSFARSPLVLLLGCATGGTRQAISKLIVLLLLLIDIVDVLRRVDIVHLLLRVANELIYVP